MKNRIVYPGLVLSFVLSLFLSAPAQTNGAAAAANREMPFAVGETLTYEAKLSKIVRGMTVADLNFTVINATNNEDFLIRTQAKSRGILFRFIRYSFLYKFESVIDNDEFHALKTTKYTEEKERVRNSEAIFDYEKKRVTYVETDPKDTMRPPRRIASEITGETHDVVSGIYALRLLPLAVGKTFDMMISDSGLIYKIPVRVTARERQKSVLGNLWCFRLEPQIFGPRRLIDDKGSLIIWITDDKKRVPVRARIQNSLGKVDVKLKKIGA